MLQRYSEVTTVPTQHRLAFDTLSRAPALMLRTPTRRYTYYELITTAIYTKAICEFQSKARAAVESYALTT